MKLKSTFQRRETKYILAMWEYDALRLGLLPYMQEDEYGLHTILSLYCDTTDYQLIQRSIDKPKYKEKFRVRSYGVPTDDSLTFLEIKKKFQKVVYKRRLALPCEETADYLRHPRLLPFSTPKENQLMQEIHWLYGRQQLAPKVLIAYDRRALYSTEPALADFRVTFDFAIRYRREQLDLRSGDLGELVAPEVEVLMEVKALGAYPLWFSHLLTQLGLVKSSFSKYAQVYQRHILPTLQMEGTRHVKQFTNRQSDHHELVNLYL
ncbi:polyphosphate polymerase domain-containing protein [Enterococcus canis]|nr:polyphosphate polymerase domain-containing protein [Enterococcus canis]